MTLILTGDDDLKVFRYNHKKTLNWLQAKVERTALALEQTDVHCAAGSQSSTFVRSSKGKETTKGKFRNHYYHNLPWITHFTSKVQNSSRIGSCRDSRKLVCENSIWFLWTQMHVHVDFNIGTWRFLQGPLEFKGLTSYFVPSTGFFFSLNFWWGGGDSKTFGPHQSPMGTKLGGGRDLQKKSSWSQNFPPNAKLGHFWYFWA